MGNTRKKQIEKQLQYIEEWKEWYYNNGRSRTQFNLLKQESEKIAKMEETGQYVPEEQSSES